MHNFFIGMVLRWGAMIFSCVFFGLWTSRTRRILFRSMWFNKENPSRKRSYPCSGYAKRTRPRSGEIHSRPYGKTQNAMATSWRKQFDFDVLTRYGLEATENIASQRSMPASTYRISRTSRTVVALMTLYPNSKGYAYLFLSHGTRL